MLAPAIASSFAVMAAGAVILSLHDFGHLSGHMAVHIASMNVAAPLLVVLAIWRQPVPRSRPSWLWIATFVQMVLLLAWHAPTIYNLATRSLALGLTLHGALFVAGLLFWFTILTVPSAARWQAILALLLTGKLACLLAALLTFATRALYESARELGHAAGHLPALDDQHLAGLLMITACPLSYLVAAIIVAVQWISNSRSSPAASSHRGLQFGG